MKTKLSKKAVALLRKVQAAITEEPNRLVMGSWGIQRLGQKFVVTSDYNPKKQEKRTLPACGTVGCIAGWTAICGLPKKEVPSITINGIEMVNVSEIDDVEKKAIDLLGLDSKQAQRLFFLRSWPIVQSFGYESWPEEFDKAYGKAKTAKERAKVACERIDHFIATGE
jgi:hypothetical protein